MTLVIQELYLRTRLFTSAKMVQNNKFLVKKGLFICEFKIRWPKWQNLSITNNEGNLSIILWQGKDVSTKDTFKTIETFIDELSSNFNSTEDDENNNFLIQEFE